MLEEVVEALLVELMRLMARQLLDLITWHQLTVAERALKLLCVAEGSVDRATYLVLDVPYNCSAALQLWRWWSAPDRLGPHEGQPPVELVFLATDRVIFKVVELAQFILHEVEAEDAVLELEIFRQVRALVATARYERENEEGYRACGEEKRVLEQIDDQVRI